MLHSPKGFGPGERFDLFPVVESFLYECETFGGNNDDVLDCFRLLHDPSLDEFLGLGISKNNIIKWIRSLVVFFYV